MSGGLSGRVFLAGIAASLPPPELAHLQVRQQYSLVKLFDEDEPLIHFELALHHSRGRVELALHFETRDADRNQRLLDYVADELPLLKEAIGHSLEAEPWDKGWTRLYLTRPIDRLSEETQAAVLEQFAHFVAVLEPLRQEACQL